MMKAAGCSYLLYGMESGSPDILRNLNKDETLEQIIAAVILTKQAGIKVGVHILVGYPGETADTIRETIRVIKTIKKHIHTLYVRPLALFPGTELYRKVVAKGPMCEEDFFKPSRQFFIPYTCEHSWETLDAWRQQIQDEVKPFNFIKRAVDFCKGKR